MTGKIGILTFHRARNYGALLQTYGLYKALEQLGKNPEIIDYRAGFTEERNKLLSCTGDTIVQRAKSLLVSLLLYRGGYKMKQGFDKFVETHFQISVPVIDPNTLTDDYVAYITGSDQVFNPDITKSDAAIYFLSFVKDPLKKYSYAASFGKVHIPEQEWAWYREQLSSFARISVREQIGSDLVYQLTGKKAEVLVDPSLLLNQNEWATIASKYPSKRLEAPYILLYYMLETEHLFRHTWELSKKTGLQVVCLGAGLRIRQKYPDFTFISDATPEQFLSLFQNATYVMTSSFHGTAFSIQFERQFISMLPFDNGASDRVHSLLLLLGLGDRMADSNNAIFDIDAPIQWDEVNRKLSDERKKATQYLNTIGAL